MGQGSYFFIFHNGSFVRRGTVKEKLNILKFKAGTINRIID